MKSTVSWILVVVALGACGGDDGDDPTPGDLADTLFVAHEGTIVSYDIATGDERPGALTDIRGPVDMQALEDGTLLVNLTGRNEILMFDGRTMLETQHYETSRMGATRPVHSFISPEHDGERYWLTLNDGEEGARETNSALFIDIVPDSPTYLGAVGEVGLGIGHHKASFSATRARVVISNISDCDDVITVYDYSDIDDIVPVATLTAEQAGWDAADPGEGGFDPPFCDPTYQRGLPPAPHGCATSSESGKAYCNLTGNGAMVVIDLDAEAPTFTMLPTGGAGGGFTVAHEGGQYLYTMQETPREGDGGVSCQVGQVVVTDGATDTVVSQTPLLYRGPDCADELAGTPAETANAGHAYFHEDRLFIPSSGGFEVGDARVDQLMILDTTDPAHPAQLPSLTVGVHTSHSAGAHSGDGKWLFDVHSVDGTVSQVDCETSEIVRTLSVESEPRVAATFGTVEGPSHQTGPVP